MTEQQPTDATAGDPTDWTELQARAAALLTATLSAVGDWSAPTPCTEWDARALLHHVVEEQMWVPGLLAGGDVDEVAEDLERPLARLAEEEGPGLAAQWRSMVDPVAAAWRGTDPDATVHLSYGPARVRHYLAQQTFDTAVHAWDLGASQGVDVPWDDELAVAVRDFARRDLAADPATGLFDAAVPGYDSPDADPRDSALAATGRDPRWTPPAA